jgi:hypothetical protein
MNPARPAHELADVVHLFGDPFVNRCHPSAHQQRALSAIARCRTDALGGHIDQCDTCGHVRISYNSCRNRHCPKCQGTNRERWILRRTDDLLPVTYFHGVFTLPLALNTFCLHHPRALYDMLFHAARDTVLTLGRDPKHLGATTGMIAVLHTWGQNLSLHPHVHCIVPGGGVTASGQWKCCRAKGKYLFPVKVMSKMFRGKFMHALKTFCAQQHIALPASLIDQLYANPWVVYAKQPFLGTQQVIEYLGRYTHRIAISNHRIKSITDGKVTFSYKDYRDGARQKLMTLDGEEFLRRFCMHILPHRFVKIRHYGLLASRTKPKLKMQQMKMGVNIIAKDKPSWQWIAKHRMGYDVDQCPCCQKGKMITIHCFGAHAPPGVRRIPPSPSSKATLSA